MDTYTANPNGNTIITIQSNGVEYDRFRKLTERLVKAPKKELDEARERERLAKG